MVVHDFFLCPFHTLRMHFFTGLNRNLGKTAEVLSQQAVSVGLFPSFHAKIHPTAAPTEEMLDARAENGAAIATDAIYNYI